MSPQHTSRPPDANAPAAAKDLSLEIIVLSLPGSLDPAPCVAAARAGELGILDLTFVSDVGAAGLAVEALSSSGNSRIGLLLAGRFGPLELAALRAIRSCECIILMPQNAADLRRTIAECGKVARRVGVVVTSVAEAEAAAASGCSFLLVKGNEAGGLVGEETSFVLLQRLAAKTELPLYAWGGIGLYTAAACLQAGAQGIVLDWQMALLDDIAAPLWIRRRLAAADGSETLALPIGGGRALRFHAQGPGEAKKLMLRLAERIAEEDLPDEQWQRELAELTSADANERLLLAGQDWAFAANFRCHADSVAGALELLRRKGRQQLLAAASAKALQRGAAIAQSHGTEFPLVQGPMTRVSDCAEFCAAVAEAGALPFLALALMPGPQVEDLLRRTRDRLGSRPWGVGILGFAGRELREAQFQAIEKLRPPFALIAGGRPDQAAALEALDIRAYLHVPSPVMLKAFLKDGCRRFVFEGRECGGHVGPRSSFVLWESMIEVLLQAGLSADEAREVHVLFAGGIHDGLSAAMVAALAQPLVEQGMKIGGLMGTAYLFTEEVVASGAVVPQFQQVALDAAGTSVVECGPGHAIRCAETPFVDHFERERRRLRSEVRHGDESREVLESLCLGRLRIASKGIARKPQIVASESPYVEVDERRQHDEGMYMLGQVAALRDNRLRIRQLHEEVCGTGPAANRGLGTVGLAAAKPVVQPFEIAIVGMGCLLPGAPNMAAFWENILARRDCLREVPSDRFEAERWYDPDRAQRDKIYSKWGGFLEDVVFNPLKYGIPPKSLPSIEPAQLLTLELVNQALRDAGLDKQNPYRERTSVILGAGGGLGELGTNYAVRSMLPRFVENPDESLWQELPEWTEDSFAGFLLNVLAGRVASRFDLGGVNYTVDAACASSLAAVYLSCRELTDGSSDVVIAGGVDTMQHPFSFTAFAKTEALSPRGKCRPFDASADGIAISEGLAAVVLKRLTDAQRDGDRIYAVLRGVAGGSDGRHTSITAPSRGGQRRTLERAYIQAQVRPSDCDLFEAHGTGTAVGDVIECETLGAVLRADGASRGSKSLGSVKSMIGHTKSAAGVAGLIKAALAVYHGVLPATLHVEKPNPKCGFDDSPLHPNTQTRPWTKTEGLRTAGVSAFGFGGTNFHAVVQEYQQASEQNPWRTASKRRPVELFAFQAATKESLAGSVQTLLEPLRRALQAGASIDLADWAATWHKQSGLRSGSARAAIVAVSDQHLLESLTALVNRLGGQAETGLPAGVYYTESPLAAQGKVAVVFPGQGSQFPHMVRELAVEFPAVRQVFERAEQCVALTLERPLCRYIFPPTAFTDDERASQVEALKATEVAQPALAAANAAMWKLLQHLGLHADMVAGHSFGELVALYAAGSIHEGTLFQLARERGQAMVHARLRQPDLGHMLAVSGDSPAVEAALAGLADVWISNHNSPRQTTISGTSGGLQRAKERLAAAGLSTAEMAVSCAFHSPLMLSAREHFAGTLEQATIAAPRMVVYANGTGEAHPPDAAEIRRRLAEHLVQGVRFAEQVRAMHRDGARIFVEAGPGNILSKLIGQTLRDQPHLCVPMQPPGVPGISGFVEAIAALFAHGCDVDLERFFSGRGAAQIDWHRLADRAASQPPAGTWLVNGAYARPAGQPPRKPVPAARLVSRETSVMLPTQRVAMNNNHSPTASAVGPTNHGPSVPSASHTIAAVPQLAGVNGTASEDAVLYGRFQDTMQHFLATQQKALEVFFPAAASESAMAPRRLPAIHSALIEGTTATPVPQIQIPAPGNGRPRFEPAPATAMSAPPAPLVPSAIASPIPPQAAFSEQDLRQLLLAIVSERTGYPVEAVNPAANLEAELGIDSIKRSEIIAAYREKALSGVIRSAESSELLAAAATIDELVMRSIRLLSHSSEAGSAPVFQPAAPPVTPEPVHTAADMLLRLQEIVAERTGYPVDALPASANLESDLGIDSIKRAEILASLRSQFAADLGGRELSMEELSTAKSLQEIVNVLFSSIPPGLASKLPGEQQTPSQFASQVPGALSEDVADKSPRCVATVVELPSPPVDEAFIRGKTFLITDDGEGAAAALLHDLAAAGSVGILVPAGALTSREAAAVAIAQLREHVGTIHGLFHLLPLRSASTFPHVEMTEWQACLNQEVRGLLFLLQALQPELRQGREVPFVVAAASVGGGDFGPDLEPTQPWRGGLAGLLKVASSEWPDVRFCCLNYADQPPDLLTHLLQEFATTGPVDVAYLPDGTRLGIQLVRHEVPADSVPAAEAQLEAGDVVAVLGGARGITAAVAVALAHKVRAHFVLLGRSPLPRVEDPELQAIHDPIRLRKTLSEQYQRRGEQVIPRNIESLAQQILSGREIQATLAAIQGAGATAEYLVCDVRSALPFAQALRGIQQRSGPIRAVIHGAGVIEDRLIVDKSAESFDRVVETKLNPVLTLVNELPAEQLKAAIFFASVSGFFGNPGQGDYAAANEIVNRLARRLTTIWSGKVVSLNWGPWSGAGMVTPELARQFTARQIGLVSIAGGQRAALDELRSPASHEVRVVIGEGPWLAEADDFAACLAADGRTRPFSNHVRSSIGEVQPSLISP